MNEPNIFIDPLSATPGTVADADGNSVVLPLDQDKPAFWIIGSGETRMAVFLTGSYAFSAFEADRGSNWSGLVFDDVRVEVDPKSAVPLYDAGPGSIDRFETGLSIKVKVKVSGNFEQPMRYKIKDGLTLVAQDVAVSYRSWRLVRGAGREKIVLHEHAAEAQPAP